MSDHKTVEEAWIEAGWPSISVTLVPGHLTSLATHARMRAHTHTQKINLKNKIPVVGSTSRYFPRGMAFVRCLGQEDSI